MKTNDYLAKIAKQKSLLKEYKTNDCSRTVYLNDGDEFQIQLFNPYSYLIGVSIVFNDSSNYNSNLLVIKPGERIWLERYLNDDKKMVFSTYFVNGENKEVQAAIANNGKIRLEFYKEKESSTNEWWKNINTTTWTYYNNNQPEWKSLTTSFSNKITDNINNYYSQTASAASSLDSKTQFNATIGETQAASSLSFNKTETGRIEKGQKSAQRFNYANYDFEYYPFAYETILIKPTSQKPVVSSDLMKHYCHECGRKINAKFKYCPYCGSKQ